MSYNTGSDPTLAELITAKFVPEIFSAKALMHTKSNLVCVNCFNTTYKNDLTKGYKVSIPTFSEGSSTEVTPGTEPTASDLKGTATSITVDNWYQAAAEISELIKIEEMADYLAGATESCSYSISKKIDTSVGVLFSSLGSYSTSAYGSDGQTFTDEIFQALVETLDEADIPNDNRCLIGDPSMKIDVYNIDKFIRNDYVREPVVPTGKLGMLYGCNVYITNNLTAVSGGTGNYGVYSHRDAIGIAIQKNPRVRVWDMGYKFIIKVIVDAAWGADEIRDTFGIPFFTRKS